MQGEGDEDVFERGLDGAEGELGEGGAEVVDGGGFYECVDGAAEDGGLADAGELAKLGEQDGDLRGLDFEAGGVGRVGVG